MSSAHGSARSFHASARLRQKEAYDKEAKTRSETSEDVKDSESQSKEEKTEEAKEGKKGEEKEEKEEKEKKEDAPPPPPHGDKTPWQVFLDTMQAELKQSKEWNESTKALASSATEFVESESVRKARQAYEATTGVVSSTAGKVVKTTAGAIAKGAVYTWETPVMKGVRKGANITGEVLDKATKPIRETEAYKNVKEVIDDGSSSRYGGWVDKEERRRRRELREKMGQKNGEQQIFEENPKYAPTRPAQYAVSKFG
jgi:import inner membrane translocase subunit TIM44